MRNWNILTGLLLVLGLSSFYFTYEELKHSTSQTSPCLATRFYFTYEELKPDRGQYLLYVNNRFYFTYEELKQVSSVSLLAGSAVFTLPMRNWNIGNKYLSFCYKSRFYFTYEELKLIPSF